MLFVRSRCLNTVLHAVVSAAILTVACSRSASNADTQSIDIATTTSVVNSGLTEVLLPLYEKETGVVVGVHSAGSGRALQMLADGEVDLVISHAPQSESRMLVAHPAWKYQKLATNRFILVGPAEDPAHVREAADVADAFSRIASSQQYFVSRGDESGTHEREMELWSAAHAMPPAGRRIVSGTGMAATLRQADERSAYTLSDDATFLQLSPRLTLQPVYTNDPRLVNSYAVMFPQNKASAAQFADWLLNGAGRQAIASYSIAGTRVFAVWPANCPGSAPTASLCAPQ